MPLARVDPLKGRSADYLEQIGQAVYRAKLETIGVPQNDRFMMVNERDRATLQFAHTYANVALTADCTFLQHSRRVSSRSNARAIGSTHATTREPPA